MVHLIKYASQVFCGVYEASTARLKRAPLKNGNIAKMLLVALRGGLEIQEISFPMSTKTSLIC